uniref:Nicotinamide-nucleotide adenylyltransferase n=1 Tax=Clastoptera arizonana TaxID=38151 RepID=A0A1B6DWK1_9HEMI
MAPTKVMLMEVGSFNPPTNMHLRLFEIARDYLDQTGLFKVIGGIVSPVHDLYGKKDLLPSTHRCSMLRLALNSSDWIYLSDWECKQEEWTRTKQVLQHHQNTLNAILRNEGSQTENNSFEEQYWIREILKRCKNNDKVVVKLVCGGDLLESFAVPGLWCDDDIEAIINDHGLVVISRSGSNPEKFIYESDILTKYKRNIHIVTEWITNEISSSKIRRALYRGQSVKYLIADSVNEYIQNNRLFGVVEKH